MKNLLLFISVSVAAGLLFLSASFKNVEKQSTNKEEKSLPVNVADAKGFVVMELFTSQGCSSCPSADDLLGKYALMNNEKIIPVAFHVDYWNHLGWKDSFSTPAYTQRQRLYAEKFLSSSVYTPQLVINGYKEMVGSDKVKIESTVNAELKKEAAVSITIKKTGIDNGLVKIDYTVSGASDKTDIVMLLVQDKAITKIRAGENDGLSLNNYNVVRDFVTAKMDAAGEAVLHLPKYTDGKGYSIVLFAQDKNTGQITGAVKQPL